MNLIFSKKTLDESRKNSSIETLNFFLEKENKFYTIDRKEVDNHIVDIVVPIDQRQIVTAPDFVFDQITGIFDYENIKNFDIKNAKKQIFSVIFPESLI